MRVNRPVFAVTMLAASLMASTAAVRAAEVVARAASASNDTYEEVAGTWADSATASKVAGLPEGKARALQANAEGKVIGAAVFKLKVPEAGKYFLDLAYPESANAQDAAVQITGTSEPLLRFVDMAPAPDEKSMSDKWVRVASFDAVGAGEVQVRIEPNLESKPVVEGQPFLLAVDSVRLTTDDTGVVNAAVVTEAASSTGSAAPAAAADAAALAPGEDSPFAAAASAGAAADSPFEMPDGSKAAAEPAAAAAPAAPAAAAAPDDDPFAAAGEKPKDADPFAEPVAGAASAPAAAPAQPAVVAVSSGDTPFEGSSPAEKVDDPFASAPESAAPAAVASAPAASAPAASADPFAEPGTDSAFQPAGSVIKSETSSPFDTASAGSTAAASSDPFATAAEAAPVEVAAVAAAPAPAAAAPGYDPFATNVGSSGTSTGADPFAVSGAQPPAETSAAAPTSPTAVNPFVEGAAPGAANAMPSGSSPSGSAFAAPAGSAPFAPMEATPEAAAPAAEEVSEPAVDLPFKSSIQDALDAAKKTDRPVLILFTGASAQATAVESTMSRPKVAQELGSFELVKVDYRANRALARKYAVKSYPYVVIMNKHGYTQGHMIPTAQEDALIQKLTPFVQAYF